MRTRWLLILPLLLLEIVTVTGQDIYKVGTAGRSIEPGNNFFSLPLQGYGDPPEGRFTIEWQRIGNLHKQTSMTGVGEWLFSLAPDGNIYKANTQLGSIQWNFVGATDTVFRLAGSDPSTYKHIAGMGDRLYAVTLDNRLCVYHTGEYSMRWKTIGEAPDITVFTADSKSLYAGTSSGDLMIGSISGNTVTWARICELIPQVISIAAIDNRVYALTDSQRIWELNLDEESDWRKIAYINGLTYNKPLTHIAVVGDRLFGAGLDRKLYLSKNRSKGDLSVRALTISMGNETVAIVGIDLCAIDYSYGLEIKKDIFEKTGIPSEAIMLNFSHSHFSPVSKLWYAFGDFGFPDRRYLDLVKKEIVGAVKQAYDSRENCRLYFGRTSTNIGRNRSLQGSDSLLIDRDVDIIKIEKTDGNLKGLLFMAGCHPVFTSDEMDFYSVGANFPGTSRAVIEDQLGVSNSVFLQTCSADINPRLNDDRTLGTVLAYDVIMRTNSKMEKLKGKIDIVFDSLVVPINVWSREKIEEFKKENINKTGDIEAEKNVRWAVYMIDNYKKTERKTMPVYIQTFNIGDWKLIGLSREPVSEYSLEIKRFFPHMKITVTGYNNDISSYLPSEKHIRANTYEGSYSFFWYGAIATFPVNVAELVLGKIKKDIKR